MYCLVCFIWCLCWTALFVFVWLLCFSHFLEMDYAFTYPWAKKELLKETFVYTIRLNLRELRESRGLSKKDENLVKVVVCREDKLVCSDESSDPDGPFYFFYTTFFLPKPRWAFLSFWKRVVDRASKTCSQRSRVFANSWRTSKLHIDTFDDRIPTGFSQSLYWYTPFLA